MWPHASLTSAPGKVVLGVRNVRAAEGEHRRVALRTSTYASEGHNNSTFTFWFERGRPRHRRHTHRGRVVGIGLEHKWLNYRVIALPLLFFHYVSPPSRTLPEPVQRVQHDAALVIRPSVPLRVTSFTSELDCQVAEARGRRRALVARAVAGGTTAAERGWGAARLS